MDESKAQQLGAFLREAREELGLSTRRLGEMAGIDQATVVRVESGFIQRLAPDKLSRLAEALGMTGSDLFARAEYLRPTDLPTLRPYLRTRYRDLPDEEIDKIEAYAARLARRHGVSLDGPAPGEDEQPD